MSTYYVEQTVELVERVDGFELAPHAMRLLSEGEPVSLERLAAVSGRAVDDVEAAVREAGGLERDEQGRLVGLALTLRPTPHRFTFAGRTLFAWCADDALMFPVVLGRAGAIASGCPATGRTIHVDLSPERVERIEPGSAVITSVRPAGGIGNIRTAVCDHGHFFASAADASTWAEKHPDGLVRPVEEAFRLDKRIIERLGWAASRAAA